MKLTNIKQTMADLKKIFKESKDPLVKEAAKIKYAELKTQLAESYEHANYVEPGSWQRAAVQKELKRNPRATEEELNAAIAKARSELPPRPPKEVKESPQSDIRLASMRSNNPQPQVGNPFSNPKKSGPTNPPTSSGIARGVRMGEANEGVDTIQMEVALFIRTLEWAKEEAPDDVALHNFTEKAIAKEGVLSMADYDDLLPQGEMKESMGGWNQHKGANVTANTKVEPGYKTSDEKQKERIRADIQKRNRDAKQSSVKEDASAGASGSSSIAGGAIPNLFTEPVKRVAKKKKKSAIGEGLDNVTEAPGSTEEIKVGDRVRLRDPNKTTYGEVAKVKGIDGDKIYCGAANLLTLPYSRAMLQLLPQTATDDEKARLRHISRKLGANGGFK